jgi:single-strand DNA-binding protein
LQTREYTDKDGNQRKATDVVLQRFRGELTLLDSKGGRAEGDYDGGGRSQSGGAFGRSSPMEHSGDDRRGAPAGRLSEQLDDDIPF